jgi:hypothetical protein
VSPQRCGRARVTRRVAELQQRRKIGDPPAPLSAARGAEAYASPDIASPNARGNHAGSMVLRAPASPSYTGHTLPTPPKETHAGPAPPGPGEWQSVASDAEDDRLPDRYFEPIPQAEDDMIMVCRFSVHDAHVFADEFDTPGYKR